VTVTADYSVVGDQNTVALSYPGLCDSVQKGSRILMADGTFMLEVESVDHASLSVQCR
jgi:pyruvate kinase